MGVLRGDGFHPPAQVFAYQLGRFDKSFEYDFIREGVEHWCDRHVGQCPANCSTQGCLTCVCVRACVRACVNMYS